MIRTASRIPSPPRPAWAIAVLAAAATVLLGPPGHAAAFKPRFASRSLPINSAKIKDLTVADIDGDHDLDLFTTNHRFRGTLLTSIGAGFVARLDRSKLSATPDIPGFDAQYSTPVLGPAGLYIWVDAAGDTHIVTKDLGKLVASVPLRRVTGTIRYFGRAVKVKKRYGARVKVSSDASTRPNTGVLDFDSGPNSEIVVRAQFMDLPFEISVDPLFPRQRILLGPRRSIPASHDVTVHFGDRHGVAWADFNQDGAIDAYISNGGNRGAINRLRNQNHDEFYFGNGHGSFHEDIASSKIQKGICRGRYAAPVDYDTDGDLDLFVGCQRGAPLLWNQRRPGQFGSQSELMQKAHVRGDLFRWIDLDGDGSPELIAALGRRVRVYERNTVSGRFHRRQSIRPAGLGKTLDAITIGDFDGDLDPDVFIASRGGNTLLVNRGGSLRPIRPRRLGLPGRGTATFSFVDYDNDGRLDVHAAPQGLYKRTRRGRYRRTNQVRVGGRAKWATSTWLDLEGDGDRDLISLIKRRGDRLRPRVYENRSRSGHWLELDLQGPAANAQAIGAHVVLKTSRGRQAGWVGQSEGSRYSSGHYRLYFGLGRSRKVKRLRVWWPDGARTTLRNLPVDRLTQISER